MLRIDGIGLNGNSQANKIETFNGDSESFTKLLKDSVRELNQSQKTSEKAMTDIATGQVKDLHQAALAIDRAELTMKTMLEVRNKALSAYKEITRIQM
jgi:flagellar hook-basal body complex protein FliE